MPIIPNFASSESIASPNLVTFTDTSTGSDGAITARRIYVLDAEGEYVVEDGTTTDYEVWPYADASITLDLLTRSLAAQVTVQWVDVSGNMLYEKVIYMEWNLFDYLDLFGLLQTQTTHPRVIEDTNFYPNSVKAIVNLFNAENAIAYMDDVYSAQQALNKNYELLQNQDIFF